MFNRKLKDFGFNLIVAYLLIVGLFLAISFYLFYKIEYAHYIYLLFPLPFFFRLSDRGRSDFMKINFSRRQYKTIRIIENLLVSLPFVLFLSWKQCLFTIMSLIIISILFSVVKVKNKFSFVAPTPFFKNPFEFTVGFRNTYLLFLIAYFLTVMSILHDNFNLGAAALGFVFMVICSFYFRTDNIYYIWIFNLSPSRFLRYKIKQALLYTLLLCVPILLSLSIFYWEYSWILLVGSSIGCLLIIMFIFAKYAAFPNDVDIMEFVIIIFSIIFLPLFFVVIFYFRNKAIEKLNTILHG